MPGSSVHGILQARILKWVAISFSSPPTVGPLKIHIYLLDCFFFPRGYTIFVKSISLQYEVFGVVPQPWFCAVKLNNSGFPRALFDCPFL